MAGPKAPKSPDEGKYSTNISWQLNFSFIKVKKAVQYIALLWPFLISVLIFSFHVDPFCNIFS